MEPETKGSVLLADGDDAQRKTLTVSLRRANFQVECVSNAREALAALSNAAFDVLLVDAQLPGNSRLELLNFVRIQQLRVPVVVMTALPTIESVVGAMRGGAVDYITKPVCCEVLVSRLVAAVQRRSVLTAFAEAKRRAEALAESVRELESALQFSLPFFPLGSGELGRSTGQSDPLERLSREELGRLSPREREIARFLAAGCAAKDVATRLALSPNTVRNHVKSIFAKLQVHSQVSLLGKLAGREH